MIESMRLWVTNPKVHLVSFSLCPWLIYTVVWLIFFTPEGKWALTTHDTTNNKYLTLWVTSFALYCVLENKSIKSAISSPFLRDCPEAVKQPAAEGEAAIIAPRPPAVASSRTRPPSNTAEPCPLGREDRPGHPFPASFFLTARLRGPEPGSLPEFRAPAVCYTPPKNKPANAASKSHRGYRLPQLARPVRRLLWH